MRRSTKRTGPVALFAAALLALSQTALAQEPLTPPDPITSLTEGVGEITAGGSQDTGTKTSQPTSAPASGPAQPSGDDDSTGQQTEDPAAPDHAGGTVADVELAGEDVATVSETEAQISDDGSSSGDVTILAIGGNEVVGAHSSSGGQQSDTYDPLGPLCEGSGGEVCLGLLFADTVSTENSAEAHGAVAAACVGGGQTDYSPDCAGLVGAGVATSDSEITRNPQTGQTTAQQETDLADVCIGPEGEGEDGVCSGVGITVLHSESSSDAPSNTGAGSTDQGSYVLAVETEGEQTLLLDGPMAPLSIPPGCPSGESLACLFLNQGESFVFVGGAGGGQQAFHVSLLPGAIEGRDLLQLNLAGAGTLARNAAAPAAAPVAPAGPEDVPDAVKGKPTTPGGLAAPGAEALAFTGADLLALLGALLLSLAAGLGATAWQRRRSPAG